MIKLPLTCKQMSEFGCARQPGDKITLPTAEDLKMDLKKIT